MHDLIEFNRLSLFLPLIFLLRAKFLRPAASQLLLFRFPPYTIGFPPIKQPLALEAEALAFGCPRKMGQKKETFFMSYLIVSWNRSGKPYV